MIGIAIVLLKAVANCQSVLADIWREGRDRVSLVELNKLKVPTTIEVRSGGEIEKSVAEHQARRKEAASKE